MFDEFPKREYPRTNNICSIPTLITMVTRPLPREDIYPCVLQLPNTIVDLFQVDDADHHTPTEIQLRHEIYSLVRISHLVIHLIHT